MRSTSAIPGSDTPPKVASAREDTANTMHTKAAVKASVRGCVRQDGNAAQQHSVGTMKPSALQTNKLVAMHRYIKTGAQPLNAFPARSPANSM